MLQVFSVIVNFIFNIIFFLTTIQTPLNNNNNIPFQTSDSSPPSMASTLHLPLIIIILYTLFTTSHSQYIPDHHFINCGSRSSTNFTGKLFVSDDNNNNNNNNDNPTSFSVSGGIGAADTTNPPSSTVAIYQTARVFSERSWYDLQADGNNTFEMVRLHFSPFKFNGIDLFSSRFDVLISGYPLLSDFEVGNSIVIKDFVIPIGDVTNFRIEFVPKSGSPAAFVNAIEAFTTPSELFIHGVSLSNVSPSGDNGDTKTISSSSSSSSSYAFIPIYRINVGGNMIDVERDTLRRVWVPDDGYIFRSEPARNQTSGGAIVYNERGSRRYDAPDDVYSTAKELTNGLVNLTWSFKVNPDEMYLVRAHFCDFISPGLVDDNAGFNFFVYSQYKKMIQPVKMLAVQVPFYVDFVVSSVDSGFVNVSIGEISGDNQTAFLNGLEIMELVKNLDVVDHGSNGNKSKGVYIVVGCVVGGVVFVFVLLLGFFIGSRCGRVKPAVVAKPESNMGPSYGRSSYTSINMDFTITHASPIPNLNLSLRFPFADILQATNGFDEKLVVGKGGFGKVYRGTLPDGMVVAVKRGEKGHGQGRPEFVTEIMVLSKIRHRHLVTLIGYCDERSEMILVYEFMEKGTLQDHLYGENKNHPKLSWTQRLEICISATRGLHYLHTGSDGGIIHRDVKSTNILLNENYVAKVADFGISRLDRMDQSEISYIKGTFGYLDPEYIRCMNLTQKSDVYSFGVVLLEVLCARPALDNTLPQHEANLVDWAIKHIKEGEVGIIMDPFLVGTINPNSLRKFLEMVERCLKDTGDERPSMIDVLWDLEYSLKLQQMFVDKEPYEDSTMNTSLELPMSMIQRLPSNTHEDDSQVNDHSVATAFPSESQVFSQLNLDDAR